MLCAEGPFCPFIHVASWDRRTPWSLRQRRNTYWLLVTSFTGEEQISVEGQRYRVPTGGS